MTILEKARKIIKENFEEGNCGIFDSRNLVGDMMTTIYEDESLTIDICYDWNYFEVFGLNDAEFKELEKYYEMLRSEARKKIKPSECEYHVEYYDVCLKNCFYCKDNIEKGICPAAEENKNEDK